MDPITTAVVAVLPALADDMVKTAVKDAYGALKAVIQRKWGESAPISKAIAALEQDPTSKAQAGVLAEKVQAVKATENREVMQMLQQLAEQMKTHGIDGHAVAAIQLNISGGTQTGIIGAANVSAGTMNFGNR